jgi:hypothetical protein
VRGISSQALTPRDHFNGLRGLLPDLRGLAILDNDGRNRVDRDEGALAIHYWQRYELENYFITPELLRAFAASQFPADDLFGQQAHAAIDRALAEVLTATVFGGRAADYETWARSPADAARLLWETATRHLKLSEIADQFFQRLSELEGTPVLIRKAEYHRLVAGAVLTPAAEAEVRLKLDLLESLFRSSPAPAVAEPAEDEAPGDAAK